MKKSIIHNDDSCFICGSMRNLETHHVWHGTANRKLADEDGLTVKLCHQCHSNLHDKGTNDRMLMEVGEWAWLKVYGGTIIDFIKRYGRNVINE